MSLFSYTDLLKRIYKIVRPLVDINVFDTGFKKGNSGVGGFNYVVYYLLVYLFVLVSCPPLLSRCQRSLTLRVVMGLIIHLS